jgi:hypothetical protein
MCFFIRYPHFSGIGSRYSAYGHKVWIEAEPFRLISLDEKMKVIPCETYHISSFRARILRALPISFAYFKVNLSDEWTGRVGGQPKCEKLSILTGYPDVHSRTV